MGRTLELDDCNGRYYFDPEAADAPCRFIAKYLRHYEDRFHGQPFVLLDWQRDQIIRPLFGWKRRDNGERRFQTLYLMTAKGSGKTPIFASIGMFAMAGEKVACPTIISLAGSFEQAGYSFNGAKEYIRQSPELFKLCKPQQYKIRLRNRPGQWSIISGKPTGRSGSRPTVVIADEVQDFDGPCAESFRLVTANLFKRTNPLLLIASNAPTSRTTFGYHLYERATAVLNGTVDDPTFLPVIYEADRKLDWCSEEAARQANPSMPAIVPFDRLRPKIAEARQSDEGEAEYRRLYLSQQTQSAAKWLDLSVWDACTGPIPPDAIKDAVIYVGVDLSQSDDLSAVAYVYVTPARMYIDCDFWLPRSTAEKYDISAATRYVQWSKERYINLVDEPTISENVKKQIAQRIHDRTKAHKVKAICFDPWKADHATSALEAMGHVCVHLRQGWSIGRGAEELDRRMKERNITVTNNPVMRMCAENAERKFDEHGNYWPVKPGANQKGGNGYKGKRAAKIDGISALVTCLTEARKHSFPAAQKQWTGNVYILNKTK